MKKFVLAAALTAAASTAYAGNMSEPMVEPEIIIEEAASSLQIEKGAAIFRSALFHALTEGKSYSIQPLRFSEIIADKALICASSSLRQGI